MFTNNQITIESLPKLEDLKLSKIALKYRTILFLNCSTIFLGFLIIFLILDTFVVDESLPKTIFFGILVVWGLAFGLSLGYANMSFNKRQYALRDQDITYSKGVLVHSVTTLPFNRIQHVEISRTFLARKFGLATLHLYSAGQSGSDLSIKGLPLEVAQSLKTFLSSKLNE
ncbi:PH domain-containing protein [Mangrovimonas sp. TPBH4]|uniref:PH domain-containing protein n=1 Tax=Mangrovimonas sp. TPBH4 TaxID=1645914 RepID=UPI0006B62616|nr:PH domain-containing protein [Mangrovimonas sp. TPBH4]